MPDWAVTDGGFLGVGESGTVTVGVSGWTDRPPSVPLSTPVAAALAGATTELHLPGPLVDPEGAVDPPAAVAGDGSSPLSVASDPEVVLSFEGTADLAGSPAEPHLSFGDARAVSLGLAPEESEPGTVTVPGTAEGLATYVTAASAALRTASPDRSHPAFRAHPPLLALGEEDVPASVAVSRPETGLELRLPADLASVFVAAPLAYYLGAEVTVGSGEPALVGDGVEVEFDPLPGLQEDAEALLQRVFGLDAAVRSIDGAADPPVAPSVRDAPAVERLVRYRAVPDEDVPSPEWPLAAYVDPTPDRARCLPYLLDRLAPIYLAESTPLDGSEYLQRALDDFFRSSGEAPSVAPVSPDLAPASAHAWLADGTPTAVFTTDTTAMEHGRLAGSGGGRLRVDLVLNDPDMVDERAVAEAYREGLAGHAVEVAVHEGLPMARLARTFEDSGDLVHYVGHCETGGLVCPDGTLATTSLSSVGTRTAFLNACGSVHEGRGLVDAGAAAAAVTLTAVLNDQAATVGTAFARLLAGGLTVERAMQLARSGVMMGSDYAVVGDGTVSVAPAYGDPAVLEVASGDPGFAVAYRVRSSREAGRRYRDPFTGERRLYGDPSAASLDAEQVGDLCREHPVPVVLDGEVRTAEDVARDLA